MRLGPRDDAHNEPKDIHKYNKIQTHMLVGHHKQYIVHYFLSYPLQQDKDMHS